MSFSLVHTIRVLYVVRVQQYIYLAVGITLETGVNERLREKKTERTNERKKEKRNDSGKRKRKREIENDGE